MRALGVVAVDGDGLQSQPPALGVDAGDLLRRCLGRHIHGLGNGAGKERLHRGHHAHVAHVMDGALAVGRLQRAVKHRQMLRLQVRRALDGAVLVDVVDDFRRFLVGVAELQERRGHHVVDDLDQPAAHQLLVLHQGQVRLDARGVAIHHEADGAGGGQHGDLRVAVAVLHAAGQALIPGLLGRFPQILRNIARVDVLQRLAVHGNDPQEGVAIDREALAGFQFRRRCATIAGKPRRASGR